MKIDTSERRAAAVQAGRDLTGGDEAKRRAARAYLIEEATSALGNSRGLLEGVAAMLREEDRPVRADHVVALAMAHQAHGTLALNVLTLAGQDR